MRGQFTTALSVLLTGIAHFGASIPNELRRADSISVVPSEAITHKELGPQLSKNASIYFPDNSQFANVTERWSSFTTPDYALVVVPGVSEDVAAAVKFANKYNLPFLAVNRGHGTITSLSNVKRGVNIYVNALESIEVAADHNSALLGGGTYVDIVIRELAIYGKVATSGTCGCVGMMGSGLGGGLGKHMGYFGLVLDNIIDMSVVIADGSLINVSATSHPDLYWGMRGAGHNFGIVTQYNFRIYDQPSVDWFRVSYTFTGDKLESFFEALNKLNANGTQPKEVGEVYTLIIMNEDVSKTDPVIFFNLYYAGTEAEALPYLAPFLALAPILNDNSSLPYTDIPDHEGTGIDGPVCASGSSQLLFPVGLLAYNISTNRAIYDLFKQMVDQNPQFNGSYVQFENYALEGMKAVNPDSTAYPHREDNCLASYDFQYPPGADNDEIAVKYGHQAREMFHAGDLPGRPFNAYVNYAYGDEGLQAMYGYEPWRLEKLRDLKHTYDPEGKFNFYAPIS